MVDDTDAQPGDAADQDGSSVAPTAPRRRRRAASRPAGPPAPVPESDQAQLFMTAPVPEGPDGSGADEPAPEEDAGEPEPTDGSGEEGVEAPEAGADAPGGSGPDAGAPAETAPPTSAPRRSRRATRGVTTVAFSSVPETEPVAPTTAVAAAEPAAAALFQPPDETRAVRSRRSRGTSTPAAEQLPADEAPSDGPKGAGEPAHPEDAGAPGTARRRRSSAGSRSAGRPSGERADTAAGPETPEGSEGAGAAEAEGADGQDGDAQDAEARDAEARDAEARDAETQDAEGQDAEGQDAEGQDAEGQDGDAQQSDEHAEDGAPRRRRRRGGRRRRRSGSPSGAEGDSGDDESRGSRQDAPDEASPDSGSRADSGAGADGEPGETDTDADGDADAGTDSESDESGESSSARRRRRRRRRAGVAEEMEDLSSEDPPNTVVKVREGRKPRDEITSVRGSTRIEAKKQRRRDGREAGRRRAPILTEAEFLARRESVNRVMCVREHGDRTQIAVLEDGILVEHYVNRAESSSLVGNVYLGKVQNVLPSMEAAFVDIGRGRNAVLYAGEVNWDAAGLEGQPKRIELAMKSGDPVLVQVTKDPVGHKGARLTSQISLPGRFLVFVPEGSMTGISRKLPDTERSRLKGILKDVVPEGAGVIVRTAAEGASEEQLTDDVTRLAAQWADITKKAKSASPPALLYGEPDLAIKVVRDIFNEDFTTLLVQGESTWQTLSEYIGWVAPDLLPKVSKWVESEDLYAAHRIDEQLAKALDRKVWLPSGGSLVIDRTEAMTVVDVNTGKFTGQGGNLEETVTKNNLEAAEEIVRQLRLRDIGGIIVVDFIDMVLESNRDLVLRRLVECLGRDRTKHQVAEVTSLGLVQMTRKRIGQGLLEVFSTPCEACGGRGHIVSTEPVGGDGTVEEPNGRRERGGRRGGRKSAPAALGGKQTGKTPPPPKFDDEAHAAHESGAFPERDAAHPGDGAQEVDTPPEAGADQQGAAHATEATDVAPEPAGAGADDAEGQSVEAHQDAAAQAEHGESQDPADVLEPEGGLQQDAV